MADKYLVNVNLDDRSYPIYIQRNSLKKWTTYLSDFLNNRQCMIISDSNTYALYADRLLDMLSHTNSVLYASVFPAGETSKNLDRVSRFYHKLASVGLKRDAVILALGGGVTGDMAGFVAATWMRGIDFIQVPTSLLAMVDSSVGGKTGIDLPEGKNLVGAFLQPKCVLIDPDFLKTLPSRDRVSALAEIIKYGVIYDHRLFASLEQNLDKIRDFDLDFMTDLIVRSCQIKADIVASDETESRGIRDILNFGHTFGHALERATHYEVYLHGEAVAVGMCVATTLAQRLGLLDPSDADRIIRLIEAAGLPIHPVAISPDTVWDAFALDKKVRSSGQRWVLPDAIGKVRVLLIKDDDLNELKSVVYDAFNRA